MLISQEFISVGKQDDVDWDEIKPIIYQIIEEYIEGNKPLVLSEIIKEVVSD